jgi:aspartokinase
MLEMASSGSKVMQSRSVEFAKKFGVTFEVRSWEGASFMPGLVTRFRRDGSRWIRVETDPGPGIAAG